MRSLANWVVPIMVPTGLLAAQSAPGSSQQAPQATFRSGVELVTVTVSVRDQRGRVVQNLTRKDFTVLDSGERVEIRDFYSGDSPISLAVLLDISGSMAIDRNIDRAREAVSVTAASLRTSTDEAALYTFDSQLAEVVSFTRDLGRIRRASLTGTPWGKTSLYDAIGHAASTVGERANRHRALLVVTDGVDTGSRRTAAQVSGIASSIDVPVYLLTVVSPLDHPGSEFEVSSDGRAVQTATLDDLARWTGGDMRITSTTEHISVAVRDLLAELRYQYLITFEPGVRPGWHPLEVRTRNESFVVHARGGYMSNPPGGGS
jgi:Ca-activated chloride channel family protein